MTSIPILEAVLLILLSGLFGVFLGELPRKVIYGVAAVAIVLIVVVLGQL